MVRTGGLHAGYAKETGDAEFFVCVGDWFRQVDPRWGFETVNKIHDLLKGEPFFLSFK